jgi:glycosyltransferase involved in cell wall biosynthesis
MKKHKLAVLTSHPIQYQAPLWRALAQHPKVEPMVYFLSDHGTVKHLDPEFGIEFKWDVPLLEGYQYKFLSRTKDSTNSHGSPSQRLARELKQERYDALLVHGYTGFVYWQSFFQAWRLGVPLLLRGTSTLLNERPFGKRLLKALLLRLLFHRAAACLYLGTCNKAFYQHYGVKRDKLFFTPHVVNNEFFSSQAERFRDQKRVLRDQFGIQDDKPVILFCGKLIPVKQPFDLLKAFVSVRESVQCHLLWIGEGVLRDDIEGMVVERKIPDVHFGGFLNQSEISKAYALSDLLVLPSRHETWGLVINEAMNFRLPVVTTDKAAAAYDLVEEGANGHIVKVGDIEALTQAIKDLVVNPDKRHAFGKRSAEMIGDWNLDVHVQGIVRALQTVDHHAKSA